MTCTKVQVLLSLGGKMDTLSIGELARQANVNIETIRYYERRLKGTDMVDDLICYCFGYTVDDIHLDYRENGKSTIMEKIQLEKQSGNCQCATKNPRGR